MSLLEAFLLGVFQGFTEFLPVSSSGHLVLAQEFLGLNPENLLSFDAVLHGGTLLSLVLFFWKQLFDLAKVVLMPVAAPPEQRRLFGQLIVATIPTAMVGFLYEDAFEVLRNPVAVAVAFFVSALLFVLAEKFPKKKHESLSWRAAGFAAVLEVFALIPGISRSGSVMAAAMLGGTARKKAAEFSFLLGVPIIAGAFLLSVTKNYADLMVMPAASIIGFLASAVTGFFMIKYLLRFFVNHALTFFAVYLAIAGVSVLLLLR